MPFDNSTALKDIGDALSAYDAALAIYGRQDEEPEFGYADENGVGERYMYAPTTKATELLTLMVRTVERYAPNGIKHSIPTTKHDSVTGKDVPLSLDRLNSELAKVPDYGKNDQKQVTAWAGIRNDAAHGNHGNYTDDQVRNMLPAIRDFIARNPS
jgi:hypothetical protein